MLDKISESIAAKSGDNLADWFREVDLPLRLISRSSSLMTDKDKKMEEEESEEDVSKLLISYELMPLDELASSGIDRNTCLFLNELSGHSHVYSDAAKAQRR